MNEQTSSCGCYNECDNGCNYTNGCYNSCNPCCSCNSCGYSCNHTGWNGTTTNWIWWIIIFIIFLYLINGFGNNSWSC